MIFMDELQAQIDELKREIEEVRQENSTLMFKKIGSSSKDIKNAQITTKGISNVGIGKGTLQNNLTGFGNTGVGVDTLDACSASSGNTAVGALALGKLNSTSGNNSAFGYGSLGNNTSGAANTAIGLNSLISNVSGSYNCAVGGAAGHAITGSNNVMLGTYAGAYETGSDTFYVNGRDRTNTSGDKTKSILYGVMAAAAADQKLTVNGLFNLSVSKTPASASATGTTGDIAWDASFIYVCTATDTWERVAIATW